ncbi:UPF0223 family protein [Virgibacillus alimentarius]|uniref:UPF0223 protein J2Z81_003170 n=1 Tax=Virgibacillus alimentarius TaxID=698769 RepID=A0ABS4SCE1_9BACI|nr:MULTISPECIES: UPF0223 family protein [Virgibacillus]MBP2259176.1 uncharacterized protein YktA (UPF0223 family) [Virgibacillus alimentarius]HLR66013.1 UPF0223 family protein [Virgibacillus sp.]
MNYHYPIDYTWTKQEIIDVVGFFTLIEQAYEASVERDILIAAYRKFKKIIPSKSEEKSYFSEFQKVSGYSSYHVIKQARETTDKKIKMK